MTTATLPARDNMLIRCGLLFMPIALMASSLSAQQNEPRVVDQKFYLEQADAAIRDGRLTQAGQMIAWLEQSVEPNFSDDVALLRAEYAIAGSDVAAAQAAILVVKNPARNLCRLETAKGWVAANRQAMDEAIVALAKAAGSCPDDAGIWNLLGLAFMGKGEAPAARKAFERATALAPGKTEILNNHALAALQDGELELAMRELNVAVGIAPGNRLISANRDFVAGMMGMTPERGNNESDADWSARLVHFARGAKAASRAPQATALFSRAMLTLDHFDESVWSEIAKSNVGRP